MATVFTHTSQFLEFIEAQTPEPLENGLIPVYLDTEFVREQFYFAKVCLIQVGYGSQVILLDPLSPTMDLQPFWSWIKQPHLLKVFHAARQDLEIFLCESGEVPQPIFDTQIAAMACGFGEAVGFETLVQAVCRRQLDKGARLSDWLQRPLSEKQLQYGQEDVLYLKGVFLDLWSRLKKSNRLSWIQEELEAFYDSKQYRTEPQEAWRRLKFRQTKPRYLAILQAIAHVREETAQIQNVPRSRILRDDLLVELALHAPQRLSDFKGIRGLSEGFHKSAVATKMMVAIEKAQALPEDQQPTLKEGLDFPGNLDGALEMIKLLQKMVSDKEKVAPRLLATRDMLEKFVLHEFGLFKAEGALHTGWRWEIFGQYSRSVLHGKTVLKCDQGKLIFVDLE